MNNYLLRFRIIIKLFFTFFFLFEASDVKSQLPSCDGNRYKNPVFDSVNLMFDVPYGQNSTISHIVLILKMDIYQPGSDTATKRPLIVFMHGGALVQGDKQNLRELCTHFAIRGFVTAAINYRLIDVPVTDSLIVDEGLVQAMSDAKAAINYFIEDAATLDLYKIDTNFIFISGVSAGGVLASHVAYLDSTDNISANFLNLINENGGFSGNSNSLSHHTISIKGVINYSGALLDKEFINEGGPSLFSVHDDGDTIVPCNRGKSTAFPFSVYCDGSCAMEQQASSLGVYNELLLNHSSSHCGYFSVFPFADTVIQRTADFLYGRICPTVTGVKDQDHLQNIMQLCPNPAEETINVRFQAILKTDERFQIFNMVGILLREGEATQSFQINISDLPKGFYFIRINHHPDQISSFCKI